METLYVVLLFIGFLFISAGFGTLLRSNKIVAVFVFIGLVSILISKRIEVEINKWKPTSLSNLTTGEKYEVTAMYDGKYIVTKSLADEKKIRLIGPLVSSDNLSVGDIYIKTAEGSLEKFLRH